MADAQVSQVAFSTPFERENEPGCMFINENVQEVIEELCRRILFCGEGLPFERVAPGIEFKIPTNRQASLKDLFILEGSVLVEGSLVVF